MVVKVLVNTSVKKLNKVYDYSVPSELEESIEVGKRVLVNFGRGKDANTEGIIVKIDDDLDVSKLNYKLKSIIQILDEISYITPEKLKLAKYMAYIYFCNVYDVLKLMLPPGTSSKASSKNMRDKFDIKVTLLLSSIDLDEKIENGTIKSPKHIKALKFLEENENVMIDDMISGIQISKTILSTLEKNGYIAFEKIRKQSNVVDLDSIKKDSKKIPTEEQRYAIAEISQYIDQEKYERFLIHGVTGSGKTEVYMQLIEKVIIKGKKVIFLVPEISLTHQSVIRLVARFGKKVAILHSKMKITERKEEYKKIKNGEVDIVIGARSAIFAPISNLGMVIMDEEHDSSYCSQTKPKYSTKEVAQYLCKENNAVLVLGSATPEITSYYTAKRGNIKLIEMTKRAGTASLPSIQIADIKEDRLLGNNSIITSKLRSEIIENKKRGEQTILFLNRRGYTSYFRCNNCSYIFKCPNCDIALTYHKKNNLLHCHYCSHVEKNITNCPVCGSDNIKVSTIGTEKLEDEIKDISKDLKVIRMDADTTVTKDSLENILSDFREKKADVLIGTQMISKGHDFPNVTLVGILGVDNLLSLSEYTSNERAYQNLCQVAGRAGRAEKKGRVIIETTEHENYIIQAVVNGSYKEFYEKEISYRNMFEYPPFCDILLFELSSEDVTLLKKDSIILFDILNADRMEDLNFKLFSPKAPHIQKLNNKYRINVLVKTILSDKVYKYVYQKIEKFSQVKNKKVNMTISKNPASI